MDRDKDYKGGITAEQFLFYEIRITAEYYLNNNSLKEVIDIVKKDNLFQYPTERSLSRMTRACYKRLEYLNNINLIKDLVSSPTDTAKQINLYALMRSNGLIWDFMTQVIGEKYRNLDYYLSRSDLNYFFTDLQEHNEKVSAWSDKTINKIKSVLIKCLVETGYLDSSNSQVLNPIMISEELKDGIEHNRDFEALCAFNCFE